MKTITIAGSFSEMGAMHGEECRSEIRQLCAQRSEIVLGEAPRLNRSRLEEICLGLFTYTVERFPDLGDELLATATGAGIAPWELIVAGAYTDLLDIVRESPFTSRDECTVAVSIAPPFVAGTWDSYPAAADGLILLRREPIKGPRTLALTTAGWPAQQGINSSGLAYAITNLTPRRAQEIGLPYIAANALLASCRDSHDFIGLAENETFCSGHSYLFVGRESPAVILETSADGVDVTTLSAPGVKANHYRTGSPLDDNGLYKFLPGSCEREQELRSLIADIATPSQFASALSDSSAILRSIPAGPAVTCACFFLDPVRSELWYRLGSGRDGAMTAATL